MDRALFKVDQLLSIDIMIYNSIPLLQGNVVIFLGRRKCCHLDLAYKLNCEKEVSVSYFHSTYNYCLNCMIFSNILDNAVHLNY